jgi:hypothetical protein
MKNNKVDMTGKTSIVFDIPKMPLSENDYLCDIRVAEKNDALIQDFVANAFSLRIIGNDYFHTGQPQSRNLDVFFADFDYYSV